MSAALVRDLIVIGASAGGVQGLRAIAGQLRPDLPAAVMVVLHIGANRSVLADILGRAGANPATIAAHGEPLRPGQIYVARPDHHLMVHDGAVQLTRGAKEHHTRPAIDPLFRSAALWGGPRVVGVVLSGGNDDGTAGLQAIQRCGGLTVVQDPADAEEPAMPRAALAALSVDHSLPAQRIGAFLNECAGQPVPPAAPPPESLLQEQAVSLGRGNPAQILRTIGAPSPFTCPECTGVLFELSGSQPARYRCQTGHGFSVGTLRSVQDEAAEDALWAAVRALQEKEMWLREVAATERSAGATDRAAEFDGEAGRLATQLHALRQMVKQA